MKADSANGPLFTFIFGLPDNDHTASMRFVDDLMARDYARRKLREEHGVRGWTTVAVAIGVGNDGHFIGSWDRAADGSTAWTPECRVRSVDAGRPGQRELVLPLGAWG
jgi:hypothetical protein